MYETQITVTNHTSFMMHPIS